MINEFWYTNGTKFWYTNGTQICAIDECSCSNGDGFRGTKCSEDGAEFCEECDINDGFFLNVNNLNIQFQNRSYQNLYNNGLTSLDDSVYGYDWSETVNGKDHIDIYSAICSSRTCSCSNGSAAVGVGCPFHGEIQCDSCESGHHLFETNGTKTCKLNECDCPNGEGFKGSECQEHGTNVWNKFFCKTCDPGHSLENDHKSKYIFSVNISTGGGQRPGFFKNRVFYVLDELQKNREFCLY